MNRIGQGRKGKGGEVNCIPSVPLIELFYFHTRSAAIFAHSNSTSSIVLNSVYISVVWGRFLANTRNTVAEFKREQTVGLTTTQLSVRGRNREANEYFLRIEVQ